MRKVYVILVVFRIVGRLFRIGEVKLLLFILLQEGFILPSSLPEAFHTYPVGSGVCEHSEDAVAVAGVPAAVPVAVASTTLTVVVLQYRRLSEFRSFRLLHRSLPLRLPACWSLPSRGISRLWLHDLLRLRLCTVLYYRLLFRLGLPFHQVKEASLVHFLVDSLNLFFNPFQLCFIRMGFCLSEQVEGFPIILAVVISSAFFISFSYFSRFPSLPLTLWTSLPWRPCCWLPPCLPVPRTGPCSQSAAGLLYRPCDGLKESRVKFLRCACNGQRNNMVLSLVLEPFDLGNVATVSCPFALRMTIVRSTFLSSSGGLL